MSITLSGQTYEPATDPHTLAHGIVLRTADGHPDAGRIMTVLAPYGRHDAWGGREGVLVCRHGRDVHNADNVAVLDAEAFTSGTVLLAVDVPASGVPGTWCDGYDDAGDHCGRSLLHTGDCWH
jgi:hypothetical protein